MNTYYIINIRTGYIIDEIEAADKEGAFALADRLGYNLNKIDIVEA